MLNRESGAMKIVRRYMLFSFGAAMIPAAPLDTVVLAGVHVVLIKKICEHYGVEFSDHAARNILIAILGSLIPGSIGSVVGKKMFRMLPLAMHAAGFVAMAGFSAAVSYGIGKIFIRHFESGGTLLDFNLDKLHRLFASTGKSERVAI
jgi:uncharacterized protein (DUF697 family)